MAAILLVCHINADRVIDTDGPIQPGARIDGHGRERRIGGAGANVGSALAAAGHRVAVATAVGSDATGDWLAAEASRLGLRGELLARYPAPTPEVLILRQPDGERTILFIDRRPPYRPPDAVLDWPGGDETAAALFVNSPCDGVAGLMRAALPRRLVVAQMPLRRIGDWPAHVLVASADDFAPGRPGDAAALGDPYGFGRAMAGPALQWVVLTRGGAGATAYGPNGDVSVPAVPATRVVDTTGAGDVFAAGLLDGLLRTSDGGRAVAFDPVSRCRDLRPALRRGARWAAFAVAEATSVAPRGLVEHLDGAGRGGDLLP